MFSAANNPSDWVAPAAQRLSAWRHQAANVAAEARQLHSERETLLRRVGLSKGRFELRDEVTAVLESVRDRVHARTVGMYEELLTTFMRETLPDQTKDRRLSVDLSTKRGQSSISFLVRRDDGTTESVFDGNGGALTNVVSTALRLIALRKAAGTLRPFLVLDEPDCWIAPDRVPDFYRVLSEASRSLGIQVLAITHHDPDILERLDAHFVRLLPGEHGVSIDHDTIHWEPGQSGIRSIRLLNYRSHPDSFIPLAPAMTVLSGANNLGKSAVIDALRAVSYGESADDAIRHGEESARVDIDLGDKTLTWARNRKGNPKETYRLCEGDSELRSEDRSRGKVPDWVSQKDVLGIALVDSLDVQIGHQKRPTFLIDEPAAKQAALLSVGQEAAWIDRLFVSHKTLTAEDQATIRQGEARLTRLQQTLAKLPDPDALRAQIVSLDQRHQDLSGAMVRAEDLRGLCQSLRECEGQLKVSAGPAVPGTPRLADEAALREKWLELRDLQSMAQRLAASMPTLAPPERPGLQDAPALAALLHEGRRIERLIALPTPAMPPESPQIASSQDLAQLRRGMSDVQDLLRRIPSLSPLPGPIAVNTEDHSALRHALTEIRWTRDGGKKIAQDRETANRAFESALRDLEQVRQESGGVCPLCQQPLNTHHHATS